MKTSLDHLPEAKRERIAALAALLQAKAPRLGRYYREAGPAGDVGGGQT
jgi:hypothetical protein